MGLSTCWKIERTRGSAGRTGSFPYIFNGIHIIHSKKITSFQLKFSPEKGWFTGLPQYPKRASGIQDRSWGPGEDVWEAGAGLRQLAEHLADQAALAVTQAASLRSLKGASC